MRNNNGTAAILIVVVLGFVSLLIGISLVQTGYGASLMGRNTTGSSRAFYAANSGIEEAFYKVNNIVDYGVASPETFTIDIDAGSATVEVSGTKSRRTIKATGTFGQYVRKIKAVIQDTSLQPGFEYAIHGGVGGVEIEHTTQIKGKDTADGNVYSNGFIKGAKNDHFPTGECKNSASEIDGTAWAVGNFDKIEINDSGVCVTKEAWADSFDYCYVNGDTFGPNSPSVDCPSAGVWTDEPAPTPIPLADMGIDDFKDHLNRNGDFWAGDCVADGSGNPEDCTEGTGIIGDIIIDGDLTKPPNIDIDISGPIWVKRGILFESNGTIGLTADITEISQMIVADEPIIIESNVTFGSNGTAFLFFITTYKPPSGPLCEDSSITLSSNTNSVLFYATIGCVEITANSTFHGAILGERIIIDNNSEVEYDPELATALFGITKEGGWQTLSFKEL